MNDHRKVDDLREQLRSYHEPPPFPRESIEDAVLARASGSTARDRVLRMRRPAAAAAGIALFAAGVLAGRAWQAPPPAGLPGTAGGEPLPADYTVVWF